MYKYRLMPSAVEDLQEIADYIAEQLSARERDPVAGKSGRSNPLGLRISAVPSAGKRRIARMKGYRKILVNNYIMFVLPDQKSEVLNVMRVLYYARDYFKEL